MSRSKSKRGAPKYQRAKLAALPFLLAVLGYVLLPASDSEDAKPKVARGAAAARQRPSAPIDAHQQLNGQQTKLPDWSELASTRRPGCNPFLPITKEEEKQTPPPIPPEFRLPPVPPPQTEIAAAEPAAEVPAEEDAHAGASAVDVAALSQQPVRYFFQTSKRRVMLVGDQLLSEGQTLDSYTVTHLEPDRIELQPAGEKLP